MNELGVSAVRPLLLALAQVPDSTDGMLEVLTLVVKRVVVGNLGTGSIERRFADAAQAVRKSGNWRDALAELSELDHSRDEFVLALSRRSYNRNTLGFLRRSIVQASRVPESDGTLQLIRPRHVAEGGWPGFSEEEAAFWTSNIANTILVRIDRRPRGANTWDGVKDLLLPEAVPEEPAVELRGLGHWTATDSAREAAALATSAADVWC